MKSKKTKRRDAGGISTSSLPDIIFTLLFFFVAIGMVPAPLAKIDSEQLVLEGGVDLEDTKKYIHVYIGFQDKELVAQIGYNIIVPIDEITETLKDYRKENPGRNVVLLRIDQETGMGYLRNEIEPAILDAGIKSVAYVLEDEKEVQD